jgi:metallophosphoesterase superfamily enzyme
MLNKKRLEQHLKTHGKGDLTWVELADLYNFKSGATNKQKSDAVRKIAKRVSENVELFEEFKIWLTTREETRSKIKQRSKNLISSPYKNGNPDNVLVIGDLHEPFCLDEYIQFTREVQEEYDCGQVVFIGDIIDNHFSSYHETDPDGLSAEDELFYAIQRVKEWYRVFPEAYVCIGNHDRMVFRKAQTAGISSVWIKDYSEVLDTPGWDWVDEIVIHNVLYNHGEAGIAKSKMNKELISVVQGHYHNRADIVHIGDIRKAFAMQVGCGVDSESYGLAYAKRGPKPIIACGVVTHKGTRPTIIRM